MILPAEDKPWPPPAPAGYVTTKRAIDIAIAGAALLLGSPLWLLVGLAVRLSSPGPALFRGPVVGRDCRVFTYYKFRSMTAGDDSHHRAWLEGFVRHDQPFIEADGRAVYKAVNDPRVTRFGAFLRRHSLDEVPQLINVLRGEMSIVGPRPPIPAEFDHYDERAKLRLAVTPGITGLYQVTARSAVPFSRMLELDLEYIRRRSISLDLEVIVRTAATMLSGRGAA